MKKIFYFTAILFATTLCFSSCDRNNEDVNITLSQTSWECAMNEPELSGMLTLSFSDDENGIMKEDLKDKDGNNYTAYHLFTYDKVKGKTTLHVNGGHGYFNNNHISRVFCNTDYSITIDKQAKSLIITDNDNQMTFTRTDYAPLSLPATSMPDVDASSFKLTESFVKGTWESFHPGLVYVNFSYRIGGEDRHASLLMQSCCGTFRQDIIDSRDLYPVIEDNNTVALYADQARTKLDFCVVFGDQVPYYTGGYFFTILNDKREELTTDICVKTSAN